MISEEIKAAARDAVNDARRDGCASLFVLCDVYHDEIVRQQQMEAEDNQLEIAQHQFLNDLVGEPKWINIDKANYELAASKGYQVRKLILAD